MSNAQRVKDFHLAIGAEMPDRPTAPPADLLRLRRTLVSEEYREVMEAFEAALEASERGEAFDLAPLVHELTDLLYVVYGGILACGVDPDAVFEEVHRANLAKTTGPRRADGKQLKPEGWQPADVRGVLERLSRNGQPR
ncbi:putative HAD superfamily Cof-like phosphohydrolase [Deinobacterium chartae]|uniref:Putative HAD superfamily Cof-like phosphohydrolase n=1 Tax=Deinobacterium chartae TaxID=521158 RepID=A0A841I4Q7_9DEIO|nr:hypothetical protein [Deinobacterium chartae]MBB6098952.1 putative HAD superfamily Cof-like phosphohydrolase [Deinobacterium chartae]